MFIRITVDDELNAYTVFETLNARGLELSATDLLKNYLFSRLSTQPDRDALQRRWLTLMSVVHQESFPEFLRYHLQCDIPRVRSQRLFKLVRERVRLGADVFALMDSLKRRAHIFAALRDPQHEYWIERGDCAPYVRELSVLRVRQMTPLVFAAWERMPNELPRVLKLLVAILFRYSAVRSLNTNMLEPVFHRATRGLLEKRIVTMAQLFEALREIYVEDEKFEQDFARLSVGTDGQGKKLTRYILARLESDASGRSLDHETDPGTIEHILPENPSGAWDDDFPPETWSRFAYRLGNLTLLEPAANRRIGNSEFDVKMLEYARSLYCLTASLPADLGDSWTRPKLEARQSRLAKRAVHLWRADFQ